MLIYRERPRQVTLSLLFFLYIYILEKPAKGRKGKEVCALFWIVWKAVKLWPEQRGASYTAAGPRWFRANACSKSLQNHINGWHRSCRPWAGASARPGLWRCWVVVCARSLQDWANTGHRSGRSWVVTCDRSRPVLIWVMVSHHYFGLLFLQPSFIFYVLFSIITCRFNSDSLQLITLKSKFLIVLLSISNNITEMFLIVHSVFLHFRKC